jgi:Carboxypeptidase regulatory-like domain
MRKLSAAVAAVLMALALRPGVALAQTAASGNIEGVVKDASGALLPGVTVVVKNTETNITRETVTDDGGRYRVSLLQPGTYDVTASLAGFQADPVGKVTVQVGQIQPVDLLMRPAGVAEAITVTGETPVIDTAKTDVSNVFGEKSIQNLPINGRRWENFVLLSPGVTNDGTFGLVSYRGISGLYNNNTVDGVDNNQALFSEARGRTRASYSISQAAIREFQVGISNFSAEFGRAAGGTVNAVTRSGTNQMRGEAFYFVRNDAFQAKDFFAPFKPDENRQQFGVSVGGPLKQDRTFYFANYDQQYRNFPGFTRPGTGDTFFNGTCTAPGCAATLAYFHTLNDFFPREGNNKIFLGKVDHQFNAHNNFTAQYNIHRWDSPSGQETRAVVTVAEDAIAKDIVKTDTFVSSLNTVLSNTWLNEVRFQFARDFEAQIPNGQPPSTTVTNGIDFGMQNFLPRPKYPDERRVQVIDNVSWYKGSHSLKTGVDINYVHEILINLFQGGGVYAYSSLQNIGSDCPPNATGCTPLVTGASSDGRHYTSYTQQFDLRGNGLRGDADFATTDFNWFMQDNWRVTPQLTVNAGLRYEYQQLPQPGKASTDGIVFTGNPAYPATTSFNKDKNNFGPRIGFTYDLNGTHQTIVRGGYGIYYGRSSNSLLFTALTSNAVTFATYSFTPTSAGAPVYPTVFDTPPSTTGTKPSIQYLAPDLERPRIDSAEFSVDRLIGHDITVSASYLYSKGSHLPTFTDTNLPTPNAQVTYIVDGQPTNQTFPFYRGGRPDANISNAIETIDSVESWYHALVLQANKRFSHGLLFNTSYTLSKAEDSGQNSTTFISSFATVYDPQNLGFEKGTSSFDRRHRFVGSAHYAPDHLWGIQIGGILTLESGLPVTSTISINSGALNNTGATSTITTNGSGASNRSPFDERNAFRQDGRETLDMRVSKIFKLGGTARLETLVEAFNVFNHTNFTGFNSRKYITTSSSFDAAANLLTANLTTDPTFLTPNAASSTLFGPRDMQIGFKLLW